MFPASRKRVSVSCGGSAKLPSPGWTSCRIACSSSGSAGTSNSTGSSRRAACPWSFEIEPGTPLQDSGTYPALSDVAEILTALHTQGSPDRRFQSVADRVDYLFAAWARERQRDPRQVALVPYELFERGRRLALRLAGEPSRTVLLHGDFTPVNLLDGGERRGLVAIDPCPTLGDPAFDVIDLLFWQAADLETLIGRAESLAAGIGVDPTRLLDWCAAFAGMVAADLEATGQRAEPPGDERSARVRTALRLAAEARS